MVACTKNSTAPPNPPPQPPVVGLDSAINYGDSVFFLSNQPNDVIAQPLRPGNGSYSSFPDGLDIDAATGYINVSKSETGLKYRVSFVPASGGDSISTIILISGINFLDGFYYLNTADSIARPVYNAVQSNQIPGLNKGSIFDESSKCNSNGCKVNETDGEINLAQTVRNGVFGATPTNNDRHEFDLDYRINDKSQKAFNTIRIKLYYFETINDVTQEVYDIISSREGAIIDSHNSLFYIAPITAVNSRTSINGAAGKSVKPRPPCIFIVSR
jgi:hypothetical protein